MKTIFLLLFITGLISMASADNSEWVLEAEKPVDGGIVVLVMIGIWYGIKMYDDRKKKNIETK